MKRALLLFVCVACLSLTVFAQDDDFKKWMKDTSTANSALNKDLAAKSPDAAADAKKLADIFGQVHDYWQKKGTEDAIKSSSDAQAGYKQVADLAAAGKFDEATAAAKTASATCSGCHMAHRARQADGSYTFK